jgi:hypothetical protein
MEVSSQKAECTGTATLGHDCNAIKTPFASRLGFIFRFVFGTKSFAYAYCWVNPVRVLA